MATNSEIKAFINKFSVLAVAECNRRIASGLPFVLPSVCLAQSALECDWGVAGLMKKANAFFGIKAGGSWTGKVYVADTWEVSSDGTKYNTVANFRAYDSPEDSMRDYYEITCSLSRYEKAWSYGPDPSKWLSALETIKAIHAGGYATDDLYVTKIMNTINGRDLTSIDSLITGEGPVILSFKASDFVEGQYAIIDSGRSFEIYEGGRYSFAVPMDKLIEVKAETTFKVPEVLKNLPDGYDVEIMKLSDTTAELITIYNTTNEIVIPANSRIGLHITHLDTEFTLQDIFGDELSFDNNTLPNGEEIQRSAIAFFVEIK